MIYFAFFREQLISAGYSRVRFALHMVLKFSASTACLSTEESRSVGSRRAG
jgi:hypothetical protein